MKPVAQKQNTAARRAMLAKVHLAKKDLALAEDDYRGLLFERFGVESSGQLAVPDLAELLNHFVSLGWKPKPGKPTDSQGRRSFIEIPDSDPDRDQKRYILGLWKMLGYEPAGINARIKKQFGVDHIRFLRSQHDLQTLAKDLCRRCRTRGLNPDAHAVAGLPDGVPGVG